MSKENLDQFIQKVTDDEELQVRVSDEIETDALIALGAEHGCEFSAEDLSENAELSDEELDGVAGGLAQANQAPGFRLKYGITDSHYFKITDGPGRKLTHAVDG
jgi:predicted ribosomally synthesized peptide with nif11-like leader